MEDWVALNRANWDERTLVHLRDTTGVYDLEAIARGADVLGPIEGAEVGDVAGKRLLHLQCHFGADTVSLARRGAQVTGLDFSPNAIAAARDLAAAAGIDATFVEGNVLDAPKLAGTGYDAVFTTWGTIGWLPDIRGWAKAVAGCLASGGVFYFADGHPTLHLMKEVDGDLVVEWDWKTPSDAPIVEEAGTSYAGDGTRIENARVCEWNHPMSAVVGALMDEGLSLVFLREHDAIPWKAFPSMVPAPRRMFRQPDGQKKIPLAFSLKAVKSG